MKKSLMLLLLCLLANNVIAQEKTFYLWITDKDRIVSYDDGIPIFDSGDINDIFENYDVSHFAKAFPLSEYEYLHSVYKVRCDSIGLATELVAIDSVLFPGYEEIQETRHLAAYYPSDWNETTNDTSHLNLIKAAEAWGISQGNPNVVIGVTDSYFDLNHEDMTGKYAHVRRNIHETGSLTHGSFVAGLIAAKTDNDTGITGVGFKCRLDVSSNQSAGNDDSVNLAMAIDSGRKVINVSWANGVETDYFFIRQFGGLIAQGIYNEIYENGTVVVCGAGNGNQDFPLDLPSWYNFPAAYNHNIAVTGVGHVNNYPNTSNVKHVHERFPGDSLDKCHQHNVKVDLCAPSYDISSHYYNPGLSSDKYKYRYASGTSFAAPIVAGTVGLMFSKMSWLTPYQVEYVLKKSTTDIYSITENQKYAGSTRWKGRIGAGTLNAHAALDSLNVDSFIADYPTTLTFVIKGVRLNTRCRPGSHPGVPNPRLEVMMVNGKPPYRYKWEALAGNNANVFPRLDSTGVSGIVSTIPSLISSSGARLFYYRLTVYDNSEIEKVATKVVKIQLTDSSNWDLAMQDSWADWYEEPNQMLSRSALDWDIWKSPDLWNRKYLDGDTTHLNPEYSAVLPNYLYTRVRNVGCIPSPNNPDTVNLWLYWTLASTGEKWDVDWTGQTLINGQIAGDVITPGGLAIPSILPGRDTIITQAWSPPDPQQYDSSFSRLDMCILGRIQTSPTSNFGMAFNEVPLTKTNILNNNNIATRNFVLVKFINGVTPILNNNIIVGNTGDTSRKFTLQLVTEKQLHPYIAGHLAKYMDITLHLGDLYDIWSDGGKLGNPTAYSNDEKTVSWNLEQPLRLENINLDADEKFWVLIDFNLKDGLTLPYEIQDQLIHFRQITEETVEIDNGDGTTFEVTRDEVYGNVTYAISIANEEEGAGKPGKTTGTGSIIQQKENWFDIYPNPVNELLTLSVNNKKQSAYRVTVTDVSGKTLIEESKAIFNNGLYHINTFRFVPGTYYIQLIDKTGKSETRKFVKVE